MLPISFNSVLIIAGISVLVPVVLGLLPRLPVPGAVLLFLAGLEIDIERLRSPLSRSAGLAFPGSPPGRP